MTNIYIDPAFSKPMAWSMWDNGDLLSYGSTVDFWDLSVKIAESDAVYCEDQVPGKSWESIKKLTRSAGWVECIAHLHGKPFYLVNPRTWKAHYGLNKKYTPAMKRKIKDSVISEIRCCTGNVPNDDVIDAILIGAFISWLLSQEQQGNGHLQGRGIVASNAGSTSRKRGLTSTTSSRKRKATSKSTATP